MFAITFLNFEIYCIVSKKLGDILFHIVSSTNNVIHRTDAVHVWLLADVVSHSHLRW